MKTIAVLVSLLLTLPAFAGPCVVLDYQEMKDMPVNELVKEACKVNKTTWENFDTALTYPTLSGAYKEAMRDQEQCSGQTDRMLRILKSKGITEKLYAMCEKQAAGGVITEPAESK